MTKQEIEINIAARQFAHARKTLRPIDNCPIESLEDNLSRERAYIIGDLGNAKSRSGQSRIWNKFVVKVYSELGLEPPMKWTGKNWRVSV